MSPTRKPVLALIPLLLVLNAAAAADVPDLSKTDRTIRKEPAYTAKQPLYGLAAFGPKAESRVWMVLDRSRPDADRYDLLHIDLNADGDLTGGGRAAHGRRRGRQPRGHGAQREREARLGARRTSVVCHRSPRTCSARRIYTVEAGRHTIMPDTFRPR